MGVTYSVKTDNMVFYQHIVYMHNRRGGSATS